MDYRLCRFGLALQAQTKGVGIMAAPYTPPNDSVVVLNLEPNQNIFFDWNWWTVTDINVNMETNVVTLKCFLMSDHSHIAEFSIAGHLKVCTEKL